MIRRWEVVLAFMLLVFVAVGGDIRSDMRIDAAEKRINANTREVAQLEAKNAAQLEVRSQLVAGLREADMRACLRIEALSAQNRADALADFAKLESDLALLGITPTPEIRARAQEQLDRTLKRNRPRDCRGG